MPCPHDVKFAIFQVHIHISFLERKEPQERTSDCYTYQHSLLTWPLHCLQWMHVTISSLLPRTNDRSSINFAECRESCMLCTQHLALQRTKDYNPIFLNDHAPCDTRKKYEYLKDLTVPVACAVYTYTGGKTHLHFIWKVCCSEAENERMKKNISVRDGLKMTFPTYGTWAM